MKKHNLITYCSLLVFVWAFSSCTKADSYEPTAEFQFVNGGANFLTTDVTVNPKDSVNFQFNVTATSDIAKIILQKGATPTDTFFVPAASKNSFSGIKKAVADSVTGTYSYTFTAYDAGGYRIGTSSLVVTVNPDYNFYTLRTLYVPDTTAKTNQTYFSSVTGKAYNFNEAAANSGSIDFGYFYDTTRIIAGSPAVLTPKGHTIYALNASIFAPYDLSTWTKNATLFKLTTSVTFASLTSSGALRTAGIANLTTGAVTRVSTTDRATGSQSSHLTGAVILFKTVAGKYGAISVNYTNHDGPVHDSFISIDVKVQK